MKILAYVQSTFVKKLISICTPHEVEILDISYVIDNAAALKQNEKPDLVLVDEKMENSVDVIMRIQTAWNIPIVLFVADEKGNWRELEQLRVDGYVKETCSARELIARLYAIHRRFTSTN